MKKIFAIFTICLFFVSGIFADGKYHGDAQIHFGYAGGFLEAQDNSKLSENLFLTDFESWHLFDITNFFQVGFMSSILFGIGNMDKIETPTQTNKIYGLIWQLRTQIGPAFGFVFNDIISVNLNFGCQFGLYEGYAFNGDNDDGISWIPFIIGFTSEIQAKFLPRKKISPVVGYKFSYANLSQIGTDFHKGFVSNELWNPTHYIYGGISFNW